MSVIEYNMKTGGRTERDYTDDELAEIAAAQPTLAQLSAAARSKRDALIAETDYLFRSDYPISAERLERFKAYSQLLRDITKQSGFPTNIDWPEMPE